MSYRICCAISGHGFGHLAQTAALVNRLAEVVPDLQVRVISALPHALLSRMLSMAFTSECRTLDVGMMHRSPIHVDLPATVLAMRRLHDHWPQRLAEEKAALAAWQPDLLLADIPYLSIAAAAELSIPSVALASLSWDAVLATYFSRQDPEVEGWWQTMRQAYARATLALLPTPAILDQHPFPEAEQIGPLALPGQRRREALRQAIGVANDDERPLILVSLGGIPAPQLPIQALARELRCHWLLDLPLPGQPGHLHDVTRLRDSWSFADLSASVDGVVSKPGYGMAVAATTRQIPFLYVRRGIFPDEPPICGWLERWGRSLELSEAHFDRGDWYDPLHELMGRPAKTPPLANGAAQGADRILARFFGRKNA
ncbi:MAG: hypothetical protein H7837_02765 [Magnetococcus sp. MYC-9]